MRTSIVVAESQEKFKLKRSEISFYPLLFMISAHLITHIAPTLCTRARFCLWAESESFGTTNQFSSSFNSCRLTIFYSFFLLFSLFLVPLTKTKAAKKTQNSFGNKRTKKSHTEMRNLFARRVVRSSLSYDPELSKSSPKSLMYLVRVEETKVKSCRTNKKVEWNKVYTDTKLCYSLMSFFCCSVFLVLFSLFLPFSV